MLHFKEQGARHKSRVQRLLVALDVQFLVGHRIGTTPGPYVGIPRTRSSLTFKVSEEIQAQGSKEPEKKTWNDLGLLQRRLATALQARAGGGS